MALTAPDIADFPHVARPFLPAPVHAYRRESQPVLTKSAAWLDDSALWDLVKPISLRFQSGRKLSNKDFAAVLNETRRIVSQFKPLVVHERYRKPTRFHPKGEEYEIFVVSSSTLHNDPHLGLGSRRFHFSRKRFCIDLGWSHVHFTRHLMQRAIERDLVTWQGGLPDVEHTVLESVGLMTVWRHAWGMGLLPTPFIAYPMADGLMLGRLSPYPGHDMHTQFIMGKGGYRLNTVEPNPINTIAIDKAAVDHRCLFSTVINSSMMSIHQDRLSNQIQSFVAGCRPALDELADFSHWKQSHLEPRRPLNEVEMALGVLAHDFARILNSENAQEALRGPRSSGFDAEDVAVAAE